MSDWSRVRRIQSGQDQGRIDAHFFLFQLQFSPFLLVIREAQKKSDYVSKLTSEEIRNLKDGMGDAGSANCAKKFEQSAII